jgi:exodeoxyribonuclease III
MQVLSYNINSLRNKYELIDSLSSAPEHIICLQETKLSESYINKSNRAYTRIGNNTSTYRETFGSHTALHALNTTIRPFGTAGVSIILSNKLLTTYAIANTEAFGEEIYSVPINSLTGRIVFCVLRHREKRALDFVVLCVYAPYVENVDNIDNMSRKIKAKTVFFRNVARVIRLLQKVSKNVILCTDANVGRSHSAYDIYASHQNPEMQSGFSKQEVELYRSFVRNTKLVDAQRHLEPSKVQYTYFSQYTSVPYVMFKHNKGLTVDFIFMTTNLIKASRDFGVLTKTKKINELYKCSDHLPLCVVLNLR